MMIRKIESNEILKFEQIGVTDTASPKLNLQKWMDQGRTSLDKCFVAEDSGTFLARIIFGIFEDQPRDLKIWQIKLEHHIENPQEVLEKLIEQSIKALGHQRFMTVEYHLYHQSTKNIEQVLGAFERAGFKITQQKKTFEINRDQRVHTKQRLTYKNLLEVGKEAFISAIELVTTNTLDREENECISMHGSMGAAKNLFELLKEIDLSPTWWKLAYNDQSELVGLVVPQRFSEVLGAINYIGVVPTERGRGYSMDLIEHSTHLMLSLSIQTVIADIDIYNLPLETALIRSGFSLKGSLSVLKLIL